MSRSTVVMAATAALGLVFTLSGVMKLKGLLTGQGHKMMGPPPAFYPGWFLPVAAVHELVTVAALASGEDGAGLVGSCIFAGGVSFTAVLGASPKAAIPLGVVTALIAVVSSGGGSVAAGNRAGVSPAAVVSMLQRMEVGSLVAVLREPPTWVLGAGAAVGAATGAVLHYALQQPGGAAATEAKSD